MTSSAASETDRARNRTGGSDTRNSAHCASTCAPPDPAPGAGFSSGPAGRCTSSRTTSGRNRATAATAPATSAASPTTSRSSAVDSSARTPVRTIRWSSTTRTLITTPPPARSRATTGIRRATSVPPSAGRRMVAEPPARCMRPTIDSRTPSRSSGMASRSNPRRGRARTPPHHRPRPVRRTATPSHPRAGRRSAGPRGRPGPGPSSRGPGPQRPGRPRGRPPRRPLTRPRPRWPRPQRRAEGSGRRPVVAVQPLPQFAFLPPGQPRDLTASADRFWMRASVCSTESCTCAANSARCCSRASAARSAPRSCHNRTTQGATTSPTRPARRPRRGPSARTAARPDDDGEQHRPEDDEGRTRQDAHHGTAAVAGLLHEPAPPGRVQLAPRQHDPRARDEDGTT